MAKFQVFAGAHYVAPDADEPADPIERGDCTCPERGYLPIDQLCAELFAPEYTRGDEWFDQGSLDDTLDLLYDDPLELLIEREARRELLNAYDDVDENVSEIDRFRVSFIGGSMVRLPVRISADNASQRDSRNCTTRTIERGERVEVRNEDGDILYRGTVKETRTAHHHSHGFRGKKRGHHDHTTIRGQEVVQA